MVTRACHTHGVSESSGTFETGAGPFAESGAGLDVIIVGAGLSGLVAANALGEAGIRAVVLDKGRSAGGRLATRRLGSVGGRADHGAQFFTVRSPDFAELVHQWRRAGIVKEWCKGFAGFARGAGIGAGAGGDGHPRYCAEGGMNTIAKYLASTADVETNVTAVSVSETSGGRFAVSATDNLRSETRIFTAPVVLMSAPVPQSLALLDAGKLSLDDALRKELDAVSYARCLALMLSLDGPSAVPEPGGVQLRVEDDPMFSFVADNFRKGISDTPTMTLHVHDEPSVAMWDADRTEAMTALIQAASRWIGSAQIIESHLHGWKYARPLVGHPEPCLMRTSASGATLGFIGDAFGGAKVEGAALSALSAVERLLG
jgi:renalase